MANLHFYPSEQKLIFKKCRNELQIFTKLINLRSIACLVQKNERISDVKKKIYEQIALIPDEQILSYQGEILEDDKTVEECEIIDNSVVNVVARLRGGMRIFVETPNENIFAFEVEEHEKISDVQKKIKNVIGIASDQQILSYQGQTLVNDKTLNEYEIINKSLINVSIEKSLVQISVSPLYGEIYGKIGVPLDQKRLAYQSRELNNDKTVHECPIEPTIFHALKLTGDDLHISAKTVDGKTVALTVGKSEKISDINKKIQKKTGMHPNEKKLVFQGEILEDDKRVDEYKFIENSVINIVSKLSDEILINAEINADGRTVKFRMQKIEKISDIKKIIENKTEYPSDDQILYYQGRILEDDKTVDENPIMEKSKINNVSRLRKGMRTFDKKVRGKMRNIKKQIQKKVKFLSVEESLDFQGEILEEANILDKYQIMEKSEINIVVRLRGWMEIITKTNSGKEFAFHVKKCDKVSDLKKKVLEKIEEIEKNPNIQELIYLVGILDDDKTVEEYQIAERSLINVRLRFISEADRYEKTRDIKKVIQERIKLDSKHHKLIFHSKKLSEDKLVYEYGIKERSLINSGTKSSKFELFIKAIKSGSIEEVKKYYKKEFLDKKNGSYLRHPIHYACRYGHDKIIKFLIEKKCNTETVDFESNQPIHYACASDNVELVKLLIQHKVNIEACDLLDMRPIHWACLNGNIDIVQLLIENKCKFEEYDYRKRRPIHLTCFTGNIEIAKLLIENKCKLEPLDCSNRSPKCIAQKEGWENLINVLEEEITKKLIQTMGLKCGSNCDHKFCSTSLKSKTFDKSLIVGKGSFGKVYLCKESLTDRKFAIKKIDNGTFEFKYIEENMNNFIEILHHERIVKYFGTITKNRSLYIFMEYLEGGCLQKKIENIQMMTYDKVIHYTKQMLEGLTFLHEQKIIHRDIKPDNTLLDNGDNVKLTDFGWSLLLSNTEAETGKTGTFCGTTYYMAPEIINDEPYGCSADVWSLGATVIEMATGKRPYHNLSSYAAMIKIATTKKIEYQLPNSPLKTFIDKMLIPKGSERTSASELLMDFISLS